MHLFLIDLFISLDTLAPVIHTISKKNKVGIWRVNLLQNYNNIKLYKFIIGKIHYLSDLPIRFNEKIFFLIINFLLIFPNFILKKLGFLWWYIYYKKKLSSEDIIREELLKKKVKSITYEDSIPDFIISKIYRAAKNLNIKFIKVPSGINTIKLSLLKNKDFKYCDFYLAPNFIRKNIKKNKKKIYIGNLRYTQKWINILKKIYKKNISKKKINIGIVNKERSPETKELNTISEKLKKNKLYNIEQSLKPRSFEPIKIANFINKSILTSELILKCDIILFARSSSVILEALLRDKQIFFLNYIHPKNFKISLFSKYKRFKKIINRDQIINFNFTNKKDTNLKKKILKKFLINYNNEKKIIKNYLELYNKI